MAADTHPLVRRSLRGLGLVDPLANYRPAVTERLFTNPFAEEYAAYPCPFPTELQTRYVRVLQCGFAASGGQPHLTAEKLHDP